MSVISCLYWVGTLCPQCSIMQGIFLRYVNEEGSQTIFVKVRGRGKEDPAVSIPPSRDRIMGDFWIIITELIMTRPRVTFYYPMK